MNPPLLATLEYPPHVGGIATYLSRLVECIPGGATVLAPHTAQSHESDMHAAMPIYRRTMVTPFLRPRWLPALYYADRIAAREHSSAVLVSHVLPMGRVARIVARRRNIPYGVIAHGMDVALALDDRGAKLAAARRAFADAGVVCANSMFTAGLVESAGARADRIVVAHPSPTFGTADLLAASDASRVAAMRSRFGATEEDVLLVTAARLVERKGIDTCIAAVARLASPGRKIRLAVVGDGPDRERLQRLAAASGAADRVVFSGLLDHDELRDAFAACDVFVLAPRAIGPDVEGFGIVYLDAGVMGKPVVGTRTGGVPEAVKDGETGLLVPPNDPAALADAFAALADDAELRRRLGENGKRRALGEFDPRVQFRAFADALRALAS